MTSTPIPICDAAKLMKVGEDSLRVWAKQGYLRLYQISEKRTFVLPDELAKCVTLLADEYAERAAQTQGRGDIREKRERDDPPRQDDRGEAAERPVGEDQAGSTPFMESEVHYATRRKRVRGRPRKVPHLVIAE